MSPATFRPQKAALQKAKETAKKSFPLLELLVVVAIAFLGSFLLALSKVRALCCAGNMRQLQSGMLSCSNGCEDFPYPATLPLK